MNDTRKFRRVAEHFRDEFRAMSCKYPPIYHERFVSPLAVEAEGWQAFANANRTRTDGWEEWLFASGLGWLGRFYGSRNGWSEFSQTSLNMYFFLPTEWPFSDGLKGWMDAIHDLAEIDATPLLNVQRYVWNWEPDHHIDPETGGVDDASMYLEIWDERSLGDAEFPKYPLQRVLSVNVFSASALALDILLSPEVFGLWRDFHEVGLPFSLFAEPDDDRDASDVESASPRTADHAFARAQGEAAEEGVTTALPDSMNEARPKLVVGETDELPEFLFRRIGDMWVIRYNFGTQFHHVFKHTVGFTHIAKLIDAQGNEVKCLAMPRDGDDRSVASTGSVITEGEALGVLRSEQGEFSGYTKTLERFTSTRNDETFLFIRQHVKSLETRLSSETDPAVICELKEELSEAQRTLDAMPALLSEAQDQAEKAFRRVKQAIYTVRTRLSQNGADELAEHFRTSIKPFGFGYKYIPVHRIEWHR
jgi:hypothetical protein